MTTNEIIVVLDKYWAGESSLEEEQLLQKYFAGDVDVELSNFSDYFKAIRLESNVKTEMTLSGDIEKSFIDRLLNKYWDCTSTLEDEKSLKEYFSGSEVHSDHLEYQGLFKAFSTQAEISGGQLTDKNLDATIINEGSAKSDGIDKMPTTGPSKIFQLSKRWVAVAASLFIGMMVWFNSDAILESSDVNEDSYAALSLEEQQAYDVTMEALAFLSGKLDKSSNNIKNDIIKVANANILK